MFGMRGIVATVDGGDVIGTVLAVIMIYLFMLMLSVAMYVLKSLGLYTIAERRGIKHPWMAWFPVTNMWILGSIADQYQYVARGRIRNRRKVILTLSVVVLVLALVLVGCYVGLVINFVVNFQKLDYIFASQRWGVLMVPVLSMLGVWAVMEIVVIILTVFQYISYYNLFASCKPKNKVLFTVLSILFSVTLPFFVFACRKKDLGMPPRKDEVAGAIPVENTPEATAETMEE